MSVINGYNAISRLCSEWEAKDCAIRMAPCEKDADCCAGMLCSKTLAYIDSQDPNVCLYPRVPAILEAVHGVEVCIPISSQRETETMNLAFVCLSARQRLKRSRELYQETTLLGIRPHSMN